MQDRRQRGDQGVATAILHYTRQGCIVSVPATEATRYDLIVDRAGLLARVQVKTTVYRRNGACYIVQLRSAGGATYPSRKPVVFISDGECDLVFVLAGDGTAFEFPVSVVAGRSELTLNGDKQQYVVGQYLSIT